MIIKIAMPKIDANIDEGTVGRWLKSEGDEFRKSDLLVEIITDKATFELEAEQDGILRRIIAREKSTIPVGFILAVASTGADEAVPDVDEENRKVVEEFKRKSGVDAGGGDVSAAARPQLGGPASSARRERPARRVRATPAARRLARQEGIDLARIANPENRMLTEKDVEEFLSSRTDR